MQFSVTEVAQILGVSETDVHLWIDERGLPSHRLGQQVRLNRHEVLEWAMANGVPLAAEAFCGLATGGPMPSLTGALIAGGIHHGVPGKDRREILRFALASLHIEEESDPADLLAVLLARESLGSTGIGDGIAIPHVRNPIVLRRPAAAVTLCFLAEPVEFGAVDRKPVHTVFLMTAPSVRIHLHLLSRLSRALRDPGVKEMLDRRESPGRILEGIGRVEATLAAGAGEGPE